MKVQYATVTVHLYNCAVDSIEIFQFLAHMPLPNVSQDFLDSADYDHLAHHNSEVRILSANKN